MKKILLCFGLALPMLAQPVFAQTIHTEDPTSTPSTVSVMHSGNAAPSYNAEPRVSYTYHRSTKKHHYVKHKRYFKHRTHKFVSSHKKHAKSHKVHGRVTKHHLKSAKFDRNHVLQARAHGHKKAVSHTRHQVKHKKVTFVPKKSHHVEQPHHANKTSAVENRAAHSNRQDRKHAAVKQVIVKNVQSKQHQMKHK